MNPLELYIDEMSDNSFFADESFDNFFSVETDWREAEPASLEDLEVLSEWH